MIMTEKRLAEGFEDATWYTEHPSTNLNFVGCFALSKLVREKGFRVLLNGKQTLVLLILIADIVQAKAPMNCSLVMSGS